MEVQALHEDPVVVGEQRVEPKGGEHFAAERLGRFEHESNTINQPKIKKIKKLTGTS